VQKTTLGARLWQRLVNGLFPVLLLFWLICLPLALVVYTPWGYEVNCYWNERCARLGYSVSARSMIEISEFFRHQHVLSTPWTRKEQLHMQEVRVMYDRTFILFALITVLFALEILRQKSLSTFRQHARRSLILVVSLLVIIALLSPFFNYFWLHIFHPLLFNNDLWRTNPQDISWYLMPKQFFLRASIFIALTALLLNIVLLYLLPKPATAK